MPLRHKSAQKRARQTVKRTDRNKKYKALIKGNVKKIMSASDKNTIEKEFSTAVKIIDRASVKGIIHKNKAANTKSKLAKHVNKVKSS